MRLSLYSWWKKLFPRRHNRRVVPIQRRVRLSVECLEERALPSTVDFTGGTLSYLASSSIVNQIAISQTAGLIQITDTAETIFLSNAAKLAGFTGDGTNTVYCSAVGISSLDLNTIDQVDTVTVQPQGLTAAVHVSNPGSRINLIVNDSADTVGRTVTITANSITGLGADITYTASELNSLTINCGSGGNTIVVEGTPACATTLNCGTGINDVAVQATTGTLSVIGQGSDDKVTIDGTDGTLGNLRGTVSVGNNGGFTSLYVGSPNDVIIGFFKLYTGRLSGMGPTDILFNPAQLKTLVIDSGQNPSGFTIYDTLNNPSFPAATVIKSGSGATINGTSGPLIFEQRSSFFYVKLGSGTLSGIQGEITLGGSYLIINDSAETISRSVLITDTSLTGLGGAPIYFSSPLSELTINGGGGGNTFLVQGTTPGATTYLNTGSGDDHVNVLATNGPLTIDGQSGTDVVTIGDQAPSVGGTTSQIKGTVLVKNSAGLTNLIVDNTGDPSNPMPTVANSSITGLSPAPINYIAGDLQSLKINGLANLSTVLPNTRASGTLAATSAQATYQFKASTTGNLGAIVTTGNAGLSLQLALYDANHRLLVDANSGAAPGQYPTLLQNLQAGTYYLVVSSLSGSGGFDLDVSFSPANSPLDPVHANRNGGYALATGDLDGDGQADLIFGLGNGVSVMLGNGDGTFQPPQEFLSGFYTSALTVADFNGDGKLDVAAVVGYQNSVIVVLGNGDGSFQAPQTLQPGTSPINVTVGDLNRDGNLDLVVATYNNNLSIFAGNGDGTFQAMQSVSTGSISPYSMAVSDLNGDGNSDIVVLPYADSPTVTSYLGILLGNGDGTFQTMQTQAAGFSTSAVSLADVNNDGHLDALVTERHGSPASGFVNVLLGNGDGTFQPFTSFAVGGSPNSVNAADMNRDGKLDLVVLNRDEKSVGMLLGNGDGSFRPQTTYYLTQSSNSLAIADVNGDGNPDVLAPVNFYMGLFGNIDPEYNSINVLLGIGDGTLLGLPTFPQVAGADIITVADLNGDGNQDIIAVDYLASTFTLLFNNGAGLFRTGDVFHAGSFPAQVIVTDVNHDGRVDLIVLNEGDQSVGVMLGKGDGTFRPEKTVASLSNVPRTPTQARDVRDYRVKLAAGDVDGDGYADIVVVNDFDATLGFLRGNGDGTYAPIVSMPFANPYPGWLSGASLADVDGSGNLSIVLNGSFALIGNGDGTFHAAQTYSGIPPATTDTAFVDINGDGLLDVFYPDGGGNVAINYGGSYDPPSLIFIGFNAKSLAIADISGDGKLDLIVGKIGDNTLTILLGNGNGTFTPFSPTAGLELPNTPVLGNLTGHTDGTLDSIIVDSSGNILFRKGLPGNQNQFEPPVILNPGRPARDAVIVQTASGYAVAAADSRFDPALSSPGNFVYAISLYTIESNGSVIRSTAFTTTNTPARISAGDLNGDGLGDLVVANSFNNNIQIAFQRPDGTFGGIITAPTGGTPTEIVLTDLNGDHLPDIVLIDQSSGDITVLLNDPQHTFQQNARFRAGPGAFGVDPATGLVGSLIKPVGLAAGDLTGDGLIDLAIVNRATHSFSILQGDHFGGFGNPSTTTTISTSFGDNVNLKPGSVVLGDFNRDGKQDVAILMEDTSQLWVYLNNGNGTFASPIINAAGTFGSPTGITYVQAGSAADRILVGNAYGDILTLYGDGAGHFAVNRGNLNSIPFAVGQTADGRTFAVVADQAQDKLLLFYRIPGTNRFDPTPAPIDSHTLPVLAPGAVQLAQLVNGQRPYLIVANQLGNNVQVYLGLPDGSFGMPTSYAVGFGPIGVAVQDFNNDGVFDLAVVNHDSNDVSILLGEIDPATGLWTATAGPRISSGGAGPVAVVAGDFTNNGVPDLRVTNSNGQIATIAGIGSAGTGTGFFNDTAPSISSLGTGIRQAAFDPATGQQLVVTTTGGIIAVNGPQFTPIRPDGSGVTALAFAGNTLAAATSNGSVQVFNRDATGDFVFVVETPFDDAPISAMQLVEGANGLEIYVTRADSDVPEILTVADFITVTTELPQASVIAQSQGLAENDLLLVAVLLAGPSGSSSPIVNPAIGGDFAFASFDPSVLTKAVSEEVSEALGDDSEEMNEEMEARPEAEDELNEQGAWEQFRTGIEEALQRLNLLGEDEDLPPQALEFWRQIFEMTQQLRPSQEVPATDMSLGSPQPSDTKEVLSSPTTDGNQVVSDEPAAEVKPETAQESHQKQVSTGRGSLIAGLILLPTLQAMLCRKDRESHSRPRSTNRKMNAQHSDTK
ncbi:MAG: VCBS repeat-containing protein [Planctomycetes bacterium]|nr:VCBS repeat-containing protein [Planctomycetota bacterium]